MYSEEIYTCACAKGIETSLLSLMYFLQFHNFLTMLCVTLDKIPLYICTYVLVMPEDAFSKMNEYHTLNFVMSVVMLEHTLCFQRQIDFTPKELSYFCFWLCSVGLKA